jgi:uncharacterized protein DUF1501
MASHIPTRRQFLRNAGGGFGMLALTALLAEDGLLADSPTTPVADAPGSPDSPRRTHHRASARNVIFLFMSGGPSHLETFDPKPELARLHGQPLPASFGPVATRRAVERNRLQAPHFPFQTYGQSGIEVSALLPHLGTCVDDLCVLRGCYGGTVTHPESVYMMNTGSILMGRPSLGSWVAYGLGSENQNMPAFVVMPDPQGWVKGGAPAWGNGYLPAAFQGTILRGGANPIMHLQNPPGIDAAQQRRTLDFVQQLNRRYLEARQGDNDLAARIAAYELAFRMQARAPEVVDIASETAATRRLYGLDQTDTAEFGLRCLLARRMVERGVRFIQLYCGDANGWDAHSDIVGNHTRLCRQSDQPIAAMLKDLKARGLFDSTLVIWGGEFGRTPMTEGATGRDHNPHGFSMWLAGGGVKGGQVIGGTDAVGLRAEADKTHVHDIHATILHLLGINHRRLTYLHNGRQERLTDNAGEVIDAALL